MVEGKSRILFILHRYVFVRIPQRTLQERSERSGCWLLRSTVKAINQRKDANTPSKIACFRATDMNAEGTTAKRSGYAVTETALHVRLLALTLYVSKE